MPEDIYPSLWAQVRNMIEEGVFCCNAEIADEYEHIEGEVGKCLQAHRVEMVFEIGQGEWAWQTYLDHVNRMRADYRAYISEYNSNRKSTVGLVDVSIVALAKTLSLPV